MNHTNHEKGNKRWVLCVTCPSSLSFTQRPAQHHFKIFLSWSLGFSWSLVVMKEIITTTTSRNPALFQVVNFNPVWYFGAECNVYCGASSENTQIHAKDYIVILMKYKKERVEEETGRKTCHFHMFSQGFTNSSLWPIKEGKKYCMHFLYFKKSCNFANINDDIVYKQVLVFPRKVTEVGFKGLSTERFRPQTSMWRGIIFFHSFIYTDKSHVFSCQGFCFCLVSFALILVVLSVYLVLVHFKKSRFIIFKWLNR